MSNEMYWPDYENKKMIKKILYEKFALPRGNNANCQQMEENIEKRK